MTVELDSVVTDSVVLDSTKKNDDQNTVLQKATKLSMSVLHISVEWEFELDADAGTGPRVGRRHNGIGLATGP